MDDSLRESEFARVLQASRTHTPRRLYPRSQPHPQLPPPPFLPPGGSPPPDNHHLSTSRLPDTNSQSQSQSPPTSPVSAISPLPRVAHVEASSFTQAPLSRHGSQSRQVAPVVTTPSASQLPIPLLPDPNQFSPRQALSASFATTPFATTPPMHMSDTMLPRTPFQLTSNGDTLDCPLPPLQLKLPPMASSSGRMQDSHVLPVLSPVSPHIRSSSLPSHGRPPRAAHPHPSVNTMSTWSEPHPLNILADISSAAAKSPLALNQGSATTPVLEHRPFSGEKDELTLRNVVVSADVGMESTLVASSSEAMAGVMARQPMSNAIPWQALESGEQTPQGEIKPALGSKPSIKCSQCSSTFTERFNLNKHIRAVHERRRPFQCSTCHARFQQRDHMQKHEICVHKKLRQFSCDVCGASFGWRGVLKKHRRSVHNIHS